MTFTELVKELHYQKFSEIGAEGWTNICHHIKYTESRCYDHEGLTEDTDERRISDDGYKDSSSSSSSTYF